MIFLEFVWTYHFIVLSEITFIGRDPVLNFRKTSVKRTHKGQERQLFLLEGLNLTHSTHVWHLIPACDSNYKVSDSQFLFVHIPAPQSDKLQNSVWEKTRNCFINNII